MTNPIGGVGQINRLLLSAADGPLSGSNSSEPPTVSFQSMLLDLVEGANAADGRAQQAIGDLQAGSGITKSEVFVEMRKAELALRMTMQIRNKLVDAFDEIQQMRM